MPPANLLLMRAHLRRWACFLLAFLLAAAAFLSSPAQARGFYAISPFVGALQGVQGLRLSLSMQQAPARAVVGVPYTLDLRQWLMIAGPDPVDRTLVNWAIHWGALPAGLSLSSQGVISGVPLSASQQAGLSMAAVTVQYEGASDTRGIVIQVVSPSEALTLGGGPLPPGKVGGGYQFDLSALLGVPASLSNAGMAGPFWSVLTGNLPPGLGLTPTGTLYGTPTEPSPGFSFTVRAVYGDASVTRSYALQIDPLQASLALSGFSTQQLKVPAAVAIDLKQYLSVSGPQAGQVDLSTARWSLVKGTFPSGLVLSPNGVLQGAPEAPGDYAFTVQVSASGLTAQADYAVQVAAGTPRVFKTISVGWGHACGITQAGAVFCWGDNSQGQLGDGTTQSRATSVAVVGLPEAAVAVSAGRFHTCVATVSGKAFCWGYGAYGQLGQGAYVSSPTPVAVSGIKDATGISAGWLHSCAIIKGGITCWGDNSTGALDQKNGSPAISSVPVKIGPAQFPGAAASISAGYGFTCGLAANGKALCWGSGGSGQLGDGRFQDSDVGVMVTMADKSKPVFGPISAGYEHACTVLDSSTPACWGDNSMGQDGSGNIGGSFGQPIRVSGASSFSQAAAGYQHSCGVRQGAVYCWGSNAAGELGLGVVGGAQANPSAPVSGLGSVIQVGAGYRYSCALDSAGTAKCWGMGEAGELGNGAGASSSVPVTVY